MLEAPQADEIGFGDAVVIYSSFTAKDREVV